jgi:UDP-N-acetylglucosamine 1-carboxyvinyltransferase
VKGFVINGQNPLSGEIHIQGSKNSVLPVLAATVLAKGESVIHNCPRITDVDSAVKILKLLGCKVKREGRTLTINSDCINSYKIPDRLMREMRSSVMFLGAILGRTGKAVLSTPGGCEIGLRPIDLHISALKQMGVCFDSGAGRLEFQVQKTLKGAKISLAFPSVGATENILLAACTAKGTTTIINAAREPEIADLADFLNKCGARIKRAGESVITVEGVNELHAAEHRVIPDRIVAASYLIAAAVAKGNICIKDIIPEHLCSVAPVLKATGCELTAGEKEIKLLAPQRLNSIRLLRTAPYPGFPTDLQAPVTAALCVADGTSVVVENIFESRYRYACELLRFGAVIHVKGRKAVIEGAKSLNAACVHATDLRGGFAMITAALAANGKSCIYNTEHIDRGYESPELYLNELGADIKRIQSNG